MRRHQYFIVCAWIAALLRPLPATAAENAAAMDALKRYSPALNSLYLRSGTYQQMLSHYADTQGFRAPYEHLSTIVHELIHIDSAAHKGFFIDGDYVRPYITDSGWTALSNRELDLSHYPANPATGVYVRNTPDNRLPNILDELNAYTHVLRFVALNEPASLNKQVANLIGHLYLAQAYADALSQKGLSLSPEARAIAQRVVQRARTAITAIRYDNDIPNPNFFKEIRLND